MYSIIIPLLEGEEEIHRLLEDFNLLQLDAEILLIFPEKAVLDEVQFCESYPKLDIRVLKSGNSRASQMNYGANNAKFETICFLHADSKVNAENIEFLKPSKHKPKDAIFYFKLAFEKSNCPFMFLNATGANLRSRLFDAPFGDQGLSMTKTTFDRVGGYPTDASYGEDNLFILEAKKLKIPIICTNSVLMTSARKYEKFGWLKITLLHQYLWIKQNLQFKNKTTHDE